MNSRSAMHRAQQRQLAERQRYLADLESLGERLRADVERLRAEIDEAGGDVALQTGRHFDPHFVRPLIDRRDKLLRSIGEIDSQIAEARDALAAAQQEARLVEGAMAHRGFKFEDRMTRRSRRST